MRRLVSLSLFSVLCAAAFAVSAQARAPEPAAVPSAPAAAAESGVAEDAIAEDKAKRLSDKHCVRETGTRITRRSDKDRCNALPGRSYSKEDIDRTGHTNLADALRTLDPAIQ